MITAGEKLDKVFEECPSYGSGSVDYTKEDVAILEEMRISIQVLIGMLDADGSYYLGKYLEASEKHLQRCNRYYFYRGILYGMKDTREGWGVKREGE